MKTYQYSGNVQKDLWVFDDKIVAFNENNFLKISRKFNEISKYENFELTFKKYPKLKAYALDYAINNPYKYVN